MIKCDNCQKELRVAFLHWDGYPMKYCSHYCLVDCCPGMTYSQVIIEKNKYTDVCSGGQNE